MELIFEEEKHKFIQRLKLCKNMHFCADVIVYVSCCLLLITKG